MIAFLRSFWVLWLMLLFLGIVAWAYWPKRKKKLERHAEIPLRDDVGRNDDSEEAGKNADKN
ncbi:MAG: CcoQ/FixQ family Cbb3-type cytochrome c oxidase assembly chaperone [Pseudomonadales bacterium]|nr:cbb3-type cytochrome c oxidase subunit 3 [Pseudomonadales bacterium]NIX08216.1 CcoQ/FixQ family Cbb3-type cytochrome c oxidase assembly chaperone [Pseudomonadales bacterium]